MSPRGTDFHSRVDEPSGADDLFDENAACALHFPRAWRRRDMDRLRPHRVPFLETQGPVVEAGWQPEPVFGERRLAPEVAAVHAADLRDRDMRFVGEDKRIVGQIFEEGWRRLAGKLPWSNSANNSRCRRRIRSPPAFQDRTQSAVELCASSSRPPALSSARRCFSSALMPLIDCRRVGRGVT